MSLFWRLDWLQIVLYGHANTLAHGLSRWTKSWLILFLVEKSGAFSHLFLRIGSKGHIPDHGTIRYRATLVKLIDESALPLLER